MTVITKGVVCAPFPKGIPLTRCSQRVVFRAVHNDVRGATISKEVGYTVASKEVITTIFRDDILLTGCSESVVETFVP